MTLIVMVFTMPTPATTRLIAATPPSTASTAPRMVPIISCMDSAVMMVTSPPSRSSRSMTTWGRSSGSLTLQVMYWNSPPTSKSC